MIRNNLNSKQILGISNKHYTVSGRLITINNIERMTNDSTDDDTKKAVIPNHIYFVNNNIGVNNDNPQSDFDIMGDMNIVGTSTIDGKFIIGSTQVNETDIIKLQKLKDTDITRLQSLQDVDVTRLQKLADTDITKLKLIKDSDITRLQLLQDTDISRLKLIKDTDVTKLQKIADADVTRLQSIKDSDVKSLQDLISKPNMLSVQSIMLGNTLLTEQDFINLRKYVDLAPTTLKSNTLTLGNTSIDERHLINMQLTQSQSKNVLLTFTKPDKSIVNTLMSESNIFIILWAYDSDANFDHTPYKIKQFGLNNKKTNKTMPDNRLSTISVIVPPEKYIIAYASPESSTSPAIYIPSSQPQVIGSGIWLIYIGDLIDIDKEKILLQKGITKLVSSIVEEVYAVCPKPLISHTVASKICLASNDSELASKDKLIDASVNNASWTDIGWTTDNSKDSNNNIYAYAPNGTSNITLKVVPPSSSTCAVCFGVKPLKTNDGIVKPFNSKKWSKQD